MLCLSLSKPAGPTVQATVSASGARCTWLGLWPHFRGSSDEERPLGEPGCLFVCDYSLRGGENQNTIAM